MERISASRHSSLARIGNSPRRLGVLLVVSLLLIAGGSWAARHRPPATSPAGEACLADDGGITLAAGFCATVFADHLGHARHLVVAPMAPSTSTRGAADRRG